jgi:hypothetical protein
MERDKGREPDDPWIASYGVSLKIANNSGNTYAPLVLCSLRKTEKELPIKKSLAPKNTKPATEKCLPEIGNIALTT